MKSKVEIKARIEEIKKRIINEVLNGSYSDVFLQEGRDWIDALEWVIEGAEDD